MTPKSLFPEPSVRVIELVCNASPDPSFSKPKFERYLELYKRDGIYCGRAKRMTAQREQYYQGVSKRKIAKYAKANCREVEKERKLLRQEKNKTES